MWPLDRCGERLFQNLLTGLHTIPIANLSHQKNEEPCGSPSFYKLKWWVEMDSNQRKLSLADLQSAPFSHSGIYPFPPWTGRRYEEESWT